MKPVTFIASFVLLIFLVGCARTERQQAAARTEQPLVSEQTPTAGASQASSTPTALDEDVGELEQTEPEDELEIQDEDFEI